MIREELRICASRQCGLDPEREYAPEAPAQLCASYTSSTWLDAER
jgi:hypothetical protein